MEPRESKRSSDIWHDYTLKLRPLPAFFAVVVKFSELAANF